MRFPSSFIWFLFSPTGWGKVSSTNIWGTVVHPIAYPFATRLRTDAVILTFSSQLISESPTDKILGQPGPKIYEWIGEKGEYRFQILSSLPGSRRKQENGKAWNWIRNTRHAYCRVHAAEAFIGFFCPGFLGSCPCVDLTCRFAGRGWVTCWVGWIYANRTLVYLDRI